MLLGSFSLFSIYPSTVRLCVSTRRFAVGGPDNAGTHQQGQQAAEQLTLAYARAKPVVSLVVRALAQQGKDSAQKRTLPAVPAAATTASLVGMGGSLWATKSR